MQMFTRYLERKLWAQKNDDVIDVVLFDEHIRCKKERNKARIKSVSITTFNRVLALQTQQPLPRR